MSVKCVLIKLVIWHWQEYISVLDTTMDNGRLYLTSLTSWSLWTMKLMWWGSIWPSNQIICIIKPNNKCHWKKHFVEGIKTPTFEPHSLVAIPFKCLKYLIKIFNPARTMPFRGFENPLYTQCDSTIVHKYGEIFVC